MKIYLSGPITTEIGGVTKEQLKDRFYDAEAGLVQEGHEVVNPLNVGACEDKSCGPNDGHSWECWLKYDLAAMLSCDAIYLLPSWQLSRGALLEFHVATQVGMEVMLP